LFVQLTAALLVVASATDLVKGIVDFNHGGPAILIVSPLIMLISFVSIQKCDKALYVYCGVYSNSLC
jgi:hypothetical protein